MNSIQTVNAFNATAPALDKVSDKYAFISTAQFIADVESQGYKLVATKSPRRGMGMHAMEFTHSIIPQIPGMEMRVCATNAHDGTAAFNLGVSILVQVCSNGMHAYRPKVSFRVVHRGYALDKVKAALEAVQGEFQFYIDQIKAMQSIQCTPEQAAKLLTLAAGLRDAKPYRLIDLQKVRHNEQADNTAWNIFNRIQEALVKGGYNTAKTAEYDRPWMNIVKGVTLVPGPKARELTNIGAKVKLNKQLWDAAVETFLKAA